jgi:hypothetical protein
MAITNTRRHAKAAEIDRGILGRLWSEPAHREILDPPREGTTESLMLESPVAPDKNAARLTTEDGGPGGVLVRLPRPHLPPDTNFLESIVEKKVSEKSSA